ncbi:MAG: sigma-70 family RNA polymerase sigma factor [Sandaracinaceae bacterium]|nr:sigma-70 family RNA polymerase sigma factor [Sandaracinaceae bacterium]
MGQLAFRTALDRYRDSLNGLCPLDGVTEKQYAAAWREGDELAGKKLIEASLPFVIRIANEYRRWDVPLEDLIQQGNLGLLRAAQKFDGAKNCRLITYAVYWIRAEIRDYVVRGYRIVRLGTTRSERRAMRNYRRSNITSAEALAEESGMPLARAHKLFPLLMQRDTSLDATYDDVGPAVDRLRSETLTPEEATMQRHRTEDVKEALTGALGELSDRERRIVNARMMSDEPITLEQLGRELGVSKERVRQIEEKARIKLRSALATFEPMAA